MSIPENHPAIVQARAKGLIPSAAEAVAKLAFELPYPPTVNTYWRRVGNKTLLSWRAREYRRAVLAALSFRPLVPLFGPVEVEITFHPPDRRKRDLDNLPKGLLDALKHGGVYEDDSQVRRIDMRFAEVREGGLALVTIRELEVASDDS